MEEQKSYLIEEERILTNDIIVISNDNNNNNNNNNNKSNEKYIEDQLDIFDYKDIDYDITFSNNNDNNDNNNDNDDDDDNNDNNISYDSFDTKFQIASSTPSIASAIKQNSRISNESVLIDDVVISMRKSIGENSNNDNLYSTFDGDDDQFVSIAVPIIEDDTDNNDNNNNNEEKVKRKSIVSSTKKFIYKRLFGVEKVEILEDNDITNDLNKMEFIKSRTILPYIIKCHPEIHSFFLTVINLKQPNIEPNKYSPQGHRLESLPILASSNYDICKSTAENLSPPIWSGDSDEQHCIVCKYSFALLRKRHHCRNCGYLVCHKCSSKNWPSDMLPSTYHYNEKFVRICDCCNFLNEAFSDSLRYGDYEIARAIFDTGNINLNSPYTIFVTKDYPIHCAAEGGNIKLFKWLIEEKHCPLWFHGYKGTEEKALVNANGESCFAIACKYGNIDIIKYLAQEKGCLVQEITDLNIALRGLYRLLDSHGEIPIINNIPNDHFNCERNTTECKNKNSSSYAVAIDPSRQSCFRNLPNAKAETKKSLEEHILSRTDRRSQLNIRCIRKPTSNRALKQCLNSIINNLNLFNLVDNNI